MPANIQFSTLRAYRPTKRHKISAVALAAAGCTTALALAGTGTQSSVASSSLDAAKVSSVSQSGAKVNGLTKQLVTPPVAGHTYQQEHTSKAAANRSTERSFPAYGKQHADKPAANRSTVRKPVVVHKPAAAHKRVAVAAPKYKNNLDGWIRESLDIMKKKGIPGSYEGLHRNIMRESSGNPNAVNDWDINAINGIPSKGLLQVIQPTFDTYHVKGTSKSLTDPVANITAAANYAAHRYGSIDNVNSAY